MNAGDELLPLPFIGIKASTTKAVLLLFDDIGREAWIPLSLIQNGRFIDEGEVILPRWVVKTKGLGAYVKDGYS